MNKGKFQIFIENIVLSCLSIFKIFLLSKIFIKRIKPLKDSSRECVILGNGPSLNQSLENHCEFLQSKDIFVVNFFWKSDYYTKLKPQYYAIISRNYWYDIRNSNYEGRKATFSKIAELTNWEMTLIVPSFAKKIKFKNWDKELRQNKNITIQYVNICPIEGFTSFINFALNNNLGLPRPHNILIPSVKIATDLKFKNIYIWGADHSWFREIVISDDNDVYMNQKHFYDHKTSKPELMKEYGGKKNLATVLYVFYNTFNSYYVLERYAKCKKVKIFNATPNSYIDAFERFEL